MNFEKEYEGCYARYDGNELTLGNHFLERKWKLTENGPVSICFMNKLNSFVMDQEPVITDWQHPDGDEPSGGVLCGVTSEAVDSDGFTSSCLRVGIRWYYIKKELTIRWDLKIYPDAPGIWTRLFGQGVPSPREQASSNINARAAYMPLSGNRHTAFGFYNDTQNRNKDETEIIREEPVMPEETPHWASVFLNHSGDGGWMTVKESHKCPNQSGYETGGFGKCGSPGDWTGLTTTGWGLRPGDLREWKLRGGWANWFIVWGGGLSEEDALKSFDRSRFPFDAKRDVYMMANTWGSNRNRIPANFQDISKEIDVASELGIDVLQIDDGWQTGPGEDTWIAPVRWQPREERFPGGWESILNYYRKNGITPGLWAAWTIPDEELIENMKQGNFKCFKIDFARLHDYDKIEYLVEKARHLIDASEHSVRINWDVTENPPRVGYFFAREFGNIYLENRKPDFPQRVVYKPRLVLRDAWQISRWLPLNKFQITCQNADRTDPEFSNAGEYPHDYLLAITLMGSPIFFQELKYLSPEAKSKLAPLIGVYKTVREEILSGLVSPIGSKPDDSSHTGFQCETGKDEGYVTVFRELKNGDPEISIKLKGITSDILLRDLVTGETLSGPYSDGVIALTIDRAPGFRFLKYGKA